MDCKTHAMQFTLCSILCFVPQWLDFMLSPLLMNPSNPFLEASRSSVPPPLGSLDETIQA
jgi:hypothetical protein